MELNQFSGTTQLKLSANFWTALNIAIKALEQEPCEDAVSRKAVLDMCKKEIDHISKNWQNYHSPSEAKSGFEYIAKNIYDLPPVTPTHRWIPVSEGLPKSSGVYIVSRWFSDGEENAILTDANYYDGNGDWYNDNRINWGRDLVTDKIVAWMPLPEPYKAESEEI